MPTIPEITMPIAPEVPLIEMAQLIDGEVQMIVFEQQNIPRMIKTRNGLSLMPTSNLAQGLGLAMLGHATWNASSILVPWLVSAAGVGEIGVILSSLIWIGCLVAGVIWLGRGVLTAVSSLEDETNVTESTV
jgi:hypothetical protein